MLLYPVTVRRDADTFVVVFPDFPEGGHTNGRTAIEALGYAPDALKTVISMLMAKGLDVPMPGGGKGRVVRFVGLASVIEDAKVELYMAMRTGNVRKAELARRMGIHRQQAERLLDLDHSSRIEQLEAAFRSLGKRLSVRVDEAA